MTVYKVSCEVSTMAYFPDIEADSENAAIQAALLMYENGTVTDEPETADFTWTVETNE